MIRKWLDLHLVFLFVFTKEFQKMISSFRVEREGDSIFKYLTPILITTSILFFATLAHASSVVNSKHNLSVSGPGNIKAVSESQVCIFCHVPHSSSDDAPLWNRTPSGVTYSDTYKSTTSHALVGQPTGASKLCLSCHDGTVALGLLNSRQDEVLFSGANNLPVEEDLSDDHPISFTYDSGLVSRNGELHHPSTLTREVKLDKSNQLQCTSCHDPHDNANGKFLVVDGKNSNLCITCHDKNGWTASAHNSSSKIWNGVAPDPWPNSDLISVAENGCSSCHDSHGAASHERLLNTIAEEENCYTCHNGNVAAQNIEAEFSKISIHPIADYTVVHDPIEAASLDSTRHVECVDCHNPHIANNQDMPRLPGSIAGVKGVGSGGGEVDNISYEYELCFRCHGEYSGVYANVDRQYPEMNTILEFDPTNASHHAVIASGNNLDVPSLINPYTTSSIITCTDCHNNNSGSGNSGTGPNGPHGSSYSPLLERQLITSDGYPESYSAYELCYKCHDRNSILADQSFKKHSMHIQVESTPCTACHDPHGVQGVNHLINFDISIVSPNSQGNLSFTDLGRYQGSCSLLCHNVDHDNKSYGQ